MPEITMDKIEFSTLTGNIYYKHSTTKKENITDEVMNAVHILVKEGLLNYSLVSKLDNKRYQLKMIEVNNKGKI